MDGILTCDRQSLHGHPVDSESHSAVVLYCERCGDLESDPCQKVEDENLKNLVLQLREYKAINCAQYEICEARVGPSRHAAWVLHVDPLSASTPRHAHAFVMAANACCPGLNAPRGSPAALCAQPGPALPTCRAPKPRFGQTIRLSSDVANPLGRSQT
jgi:hypothetical protein